MIGTYVTLLSVAVTVVFILWLAYSNNKVLTKERAKETMYQHLIEQLWSIIDDIDTYGDMAKGNDKMFRRLVKARQKARWQLGITTDGQELHYDIDNIPPASFTSDAKEFAEGLDEIFEDEEHTESALDDTVVPSEADAEPQDIHPIPTGIEHHKLGRALVTHRRMFIMLAENQLQLCAPIDSTHYCSVKFEHGEEFNCFAKRAE